MTRLLAHSRSFLANQKARNAIVGAENLLNQISLRNSAGKQSERAEKAAKPRKLAAKPRRAWERNTRIRGFAALSARSDCLNRRATQANIRYKDTH